jgi:chromosome transmission fidelity protein 4
LFWFLTIYIDFQIMSRDDWSMQRTFKDGHNSDISAAAWSPNGALLVTTGINRKLVLWDAKSQTIIKTYDDARATILAMQWHPKDNTLAYTNNDGELYIHNDFLYDDHTPLLEKPLQKPPLLNDLPVSGQGEPKTNGMTNGHRKRLGTPDSLDEILSLDGEVQDDFIVDDDGAGYAEEVNYHGKRTNGHLNNDSSDSKRYKSSENWKPIIHEPIQPGSTPWRGNRRYLCLNLIGVIWTISQETHNTITVEFYDREFQRDFHFTDLFMYDKACLNENGTLLSSDPRGSEPAQIYYRPHQTWTTRTDWRTKLPPGEKVTAIALSESYVVVSTSTGYVRVYSLFGVPFRIFRQKSAPAVTCAAWRDYVLTVGNGSVGSERRTQLVYTIENVKRDETIQADDVVALAPGTTLQSLFFSDSGDPCIYDSTGTLLILAHWRKPGQAKWVPLLDTNLLDRLADGKKQETYWPVAVDSGRFHCIILKGEEKYPYFPRPLLSDFEFKMPLSSVSPSNSSDPDAMDTSDSTSATSIATFEHTFVLNAVLASLVQDAIESTRASAAQYTELQRREGECDKALLLLLGEECRVGEERGMKALEICTLMPNRNGRMFELARKVALRFGREMLAEKINDLEERRLMEGEGAAVGDE